MTVQALSLPQADLKMSLWQIEADSISSSELYVWLNDTGLPPEVTIRLQELAIYTKKAGNKVIHIGKIILLKIIEFVKAHRHLALGVAIGGAIGYLVNSIPFIGPILSPLATALGIVIFGIAGHRLDKRVQGKEVHNGILGVAEDVIEIAAAFFKLLADVFNVIFCNVVTA